MLKWGGIQGWIERPGMEQPPNGKGRKAMIHIQSISSAAYGAQSYKPAAKGAGKESAPAKNPAVPSEQVELSDASVNLKKLRDIVDATPEVRLKVVEEIKLKIKFNGYPIESNAYKAVEKLIANHEL
ncbi:MAG: flagellar biosynthesis anti-sigma factor FlgM [Chitinispirillaceae bacterium]|nr:flagellar biosynthesis anti-sigma factor FlgM [Chitinispirillaceae bacterium]